MSTNKVLPSLFSLLLLLTIVITSCVNDKVFPPEPDIIDTLDTIDTNVTSVELCDTLGAEYTANVEPIISTECAYTPSCHGSGSFNGDFTSYNGLKIDVDNGKFENRVLVQKNMPQSGPLPQHELDILQCWLDDGAPNN